MKFKLKDIKIGDIVICIKPCIMQYTKIQTTTINKSYIVIDVRFGYRDFEIIDDNNEKHYFNTNGKYLIPMKQLRLEKLKKLKCQYIL